MTVLLEARELSRRFGEVEALQGVSFSLPEGAIGLIGPNGAGKTTLLRILMGLIPPTSGGASVLGQDTAAQGIAIRERVGYMPEDDCLLPEMTGIGFVAYMGRVTGLPREVAFRRAHEVLQFAGLMEERYRAISEYSVGMRQRVKLAQALVHDPPLCILDEPTAGLDPAGREGMLGLLRVLAGRPGRSMVLSTHLLGDIERVCDQVLMLDAGRLLAAGRLETLAHAGPEELVVRVKGDNAPFVEALRRRGISPTVNLAELRMVRPQDGERVVFEAARETGTQVRYLGRGASTMEELFLRLVQEGARGAKA
ncbi:MAG TPA: ABC transporter ATP-binding protein [Thermoplasmata archaeon]|nr:ABC transporter ATP-binding protein [Thermoplasmata archaeon]